MDLEHILRVAKARARQILASGAAHPGEALRGSVASEALMGL